LLQKSLDDESVTRLRRRTWQAFGLPLVLYKFIEAMPQFPGGVASGEIKGLFGKAKPFRHVLRQSRIGLTFAARPL
jgi:hypothetical protein